MLYGTVRYYNKLKGYGYIYVQELNRTVLFFKQDAKEEIEMGDTVTLKLKGEHFKRAINIIKKR